MQTIKIGNDSLQFPDDMSDADIQEAIDRAYPQYNNQRQNDAQASQQQPVQPQQSGPLGYDNPEEAGRNQGGQQMLQALLRYGIKDPLIGAAQLGNNILNIPGRFSSWATNGKVNIPQHKPDYDYSKALGVENKNSLDKLIQFIPELGASMAAPATKIPGLAAKAPMMSKILGNAISQGGIASALSKESPVESGLTAAGITAPFSAASEMAKTSSPKMRLFSRLLGVGLGGGMGYGLSKSTIDNPWANTAAAASGALLGGRGKPTERFKEKAAETLERSNYKPTLSAAERQGIHMTPGELTQDPFQLAREGRLGGTEKGAKNLIAANEKNLSVQKNSITNLAESIYNPKKLNRVKEKLYDQAYEKNVSNSFVRKAIGNDVIKSAVKSMEKNPAYTQELKGVSPNNLKFWDMVKRNVDDMIEAAPNKEAATLKKTRAELTKALDIVSPQYKRARGLAEREIASRSLMEEFNKKEMTGKSFNDIFSDKSKMESLKKSLRNVPAAQNKVDDLALIFSKLKEVPVQKLASNASKSTMEKIIKNPKDIATHLNDALSGKYDRAATELITNPGMEKELARVLKIAKDKRGDRSKIIEALGKITAQTKAKKLHIRSPEEAKESGINYEFKEEE